MIWVIIIGIEQSTYYEKHESYDSWEVMKNIEDLAVLLPVQRQNHRVCDHVANDHSAACLHQDRMTPRHTKQLSCKNVQTFLSNTYLKFGSTVTDITLNSDEGNTYTCTCMCVSTCGKHYTSNWFGLVLFQRCGHGSASTGILVKRSFNAVNRNVLYILYLIIWQPAKRQAKSLISKIVQRKTQAIPNWVLVDSFIIEHAI